MLLVLWIDAQSILTHLFKIKMDIYIDMILPRLGGIIYFTISKPFSQWQPIEGTCTKRFSGKILSQNHRLDSGRGIAMLRPGNSLEIDITIDLSFDMNTGLMNLQIESCTDPVVHKGFKEWKISTYKQPVKRLQKYFKNAKPVGYQVHAYITNFEGKQNG